MENWEDQMREGADLIEAMEIASAFNLSGQVYSPILETLLTSKSPHIVKVGVQSIACAQRGQGNQFRFLQLCSACLHVDPCLEVIEFSELVEVYLMLCLGKRLLKF